MIIIMIVTKYAKIISIYCLVNIIKKFDNFY